MQHLRAQTVIVGAGAMGAAAAYHLARRGESVLLLEQFALGHDRGSSHGAARITRHSYADPRYARLMLDAFRAWRELEADACQNLYLRTGGVTFGPPGLDDVAQVAASLEAIGVPHRRLSGRELRRALPVFEVPDDTDAVFEPDAGMLAAARSVAVQVELARQLGGDRVQVLDNHPARRIDLDADRPTVVTDEFQVEADRLIVTAGAWVQQLVPRLNVPLLPTRQQVHYFRADDPARFAPGRMPILIFRGEGEQDEFYGMPEWLGMGVKVARHGGPVVDPDAVDRTPDPASEADVRQFLRACLPSLAESRIERTEVCLYTVAPDNHFRIGPLRARPEVIVASPCSGHGFKFSCLIGRVLADLATQGTTAIAIDPWRLAA